MKNRLTRVKNKIRQSGHNANQDGTPDPDNCIAPQVSVENKRHQVLLTLGYTF